MRISKQREEDARQKIKELNDFFQGRALPLKAFDLNKWTRVIDCKRFVEVNLQRLEGDIRSKSLQAAYIKLMELKKYLENEIH